MAQPCGASQQRTRCVAGFLARVGSDTLLCISCGRALGMLTPARLHLLFFVTPLYPFAYTVRVL